MRASSHVLPWAGLAAALLLGPPQARADEKKPEPKAVELISEWGGPFLHDPDLKLFAPAAMYVETDEEWAKLWKAWRGDDAKIPPVNFKEQLVLVVTSRNDKTALSASLDAAGNLEVKAYSASPLTVVDPARKGFSFRLGAVSRDGVRTVNGQPLKKDAPPGAAAADEVAERLKRLEQANAELRAAVERLQKEVEQLKKK